MIEEVCPFCHGKAGLNDTANSDFQVFVDTSDTGYPVILVDCYDGDGDSTQVINYCPMCGRRLVGEEP